MSPRPSAVTSRRASLQVSRPTGSSSTRTARCRRCGSTPTSSRKSPATWSRTGSVTVTVSPVDDGAEVVVVDEGDGIPPEALGRVFTKFWRGGGRGGTGLGLYIAKGIVEAHGGTIEAGRAPTGGAQLRFWLPAG